MNSLKESRARHALKMLGLSLALIAVTSCNKNSLSPEEQAVLNEDVAASVVSAAGEENGGALDQIGDLVDAATTSGPSRVASLSAAFASSPGAIANATANYDSVNQRWVIEISRERMSADGKFYAMIERTYYLQYRNSADQPQIGWLVGSDTAYSIKFDIVDGSGRHYSPRLSQALTHLAASWISTGVNTDTTVINGTYTRSAVDTIKTRRAVRTLDHTITMTFTDLKGPRGSRLNLAAKVSGTVTGNYQAEISFTSGNAYAERSVNRDFTITLGNGNGSVNLGGITVGWDVKSGDLDV